MTCYSKMSYCMSCKYGVMLCHSKMPHCVSSSWENGIMALHGNECYYVIGKSRTVYHRKMEL